MGCGNSRRVLPVYYNHEAVPDAVAAPLPINLSQYQLRVHVLEGRDFRASVPIHASVFAVIRSGLVEHAGASAVYAPATSTSAGATAINGHERSAKLQVRWNQKWAVDPYDPAYDAVWVLVRRRRDDGDDGSSSSRTHQQRAHRGSVVTRPMTAVSIATEVRQGDADDANLFVDVGQVMIPLADIRDGIHHATQKGKFQFRAWYPLHARPKTRKGAPPPTTAASAVAPLGEVLIDFGWIRRSQNLVSLKPDYDADGIDRNLPFAVLIPGPAYSYYVIDYFPTLSASADTRHPPYAENMLVMSDTTGWIRFDVDDVIRRRQRRGTVRPRMTAFHISTLSEVRCPGPGKLVFVVKGEKVSNAPASVMHYHIYSGQVASIVRDLRTIAHAFGFFRQYPFRLHVPKSMLRERPVRSLQDDPNTRRLDEEPDGGWSRTFKAFLYRYERENTSLRAAAMAAIAQVCDPPQGDVVYTPFTDMEKPSFDPESSFQEHRPPLGTLALHRSPTFLEPSCLDALAHALKYNCFNRVLQFHGPITSAVADVDEVVRTADLSLRAPLYLQQCMNIADRAHIPGGVLRMDDEYLMYPEWWSGAMWALGEAVGSNLLHTVSLRHVRLGPQFALSLAAAMPHRKVPPSLTHLDVAGNFELGERGVRAIIAALKHVLLLRHLDLSGTCTARSLQCLPELTSMNMHGLHFLGLNDMSLETESVLEIVKHAPMLETLLVARSGLDLTVFVTELASMSVSLKEFDISDCNFTSAAVLRICDFVNTHPSLSTLTAAGFTQPVRLLNSLPDGGDGREFTLRIPRATWSDISSMSLFAGSLTSLDISYTPDLSLNHAASAHKVLFAIFGGAKHNLRSLSLRGSLLEDSAFVLTRYLADTLSKSTLTALDISVPFGEDVRGPHFCAWPEENVAAGVKKRQIGRCDKADILWTALGSNKSLKYLDITNQGFPDTAMAGLGRALKKNTTLTALFMEGNQVGPSTARALQAAVSANSRLLQLPLFLSSRLFLSPDNRKMSVAASTLATTRADYETKRTYERMIGNVVADIQRNVRTAESDGTETKRGEAQALLKTRRAWADFNAHKSKDVIGALRGVMDYLYRIDPECYAALRQVLDAMGATKNATSEAVVDVAFALHRSMRAKHAVPRLFSSILSYLALSDADRRVSAAAIKEASDMWRDGGRRAADGSIPGDLKTMSRMWNHDESDACRWHGHWWWFDECFSKHHWHETASEATTAEDETGSTADPAPVLRPKKRKNRRSGSISVNPADSPRAEGETAEVEKLVDEWIDNVDVLAADELGAFGASAEEVPESPTVDRSSGVQSEEINLQMEADRLAGGAQTTHKTVRFGSDLLFSVRREDGVSASVGPARGWGQVRFEPFVFSASERKALDAAARCEGSTSRSAVSPEDDPHRVMA